jgi:hypothetical protein
MVGVVEGVSVIGAPPAVATRTRRTRHPATAHGRDPRGGVSCGGAWRCSWWAAFVSVNINCRYDLLLWCSWEKLLAARRGERIRAGRRRHGHRDMRGAPVIEMFQTRVSSLTRPLSMPGFRPPRSRRRRAGRGRGQGARVRGDRLRSPRDRRSAPSSAGCLPGVFRRTCASAWPCARIGSSRSRGSP